MARNTFLDAHDNNYDAYHGTQRRVKAGLWTWTGLWTGWTVDWTMVYTCNRCLTRPTPCQTRPTPCLQFCRARRWDSGDSECSTTRCLLQRKGIWTPQIGMCIVWPLCAQQYEAILLHVNILSLYAGACEMRVQREFQ